MKDIKETTYGHYSGEDFVMFFTSESKVINKVYALSKKYPDKVVITYVNEDGSICANLPWEWFKISPKAKRTMTDEQREAVRLRAKEMSSKRIRDSDKQ